MESWNLKPEEIKKRIGDMVWSFSRVNAGSCKYAWYLQYVERQDGLENAFAQFGTVCHETIEKLLKGELDIFTAPDYYKERYAEVVTCDFPANKYADLGQKAYEAGLDYFNNFNFDFDRYEVLGVEKEVLFKVGEYPFKGYIDALYRDKETGEIIIRDHKTSSFKYLKDGSISKTSAQQFDHYRKQELLYAIPIIEEYGRVDCLSWNMIRDQRIIKIPFDEKEFEQTKQWAVEQIHKIEEEMLWLPDTSSSYYCQVLCGQRGHCLYHQ